MKTKIYPSITTIDGNKWQDKIAEIKKLKIKEACFFPTVLSPQKRKLAYKLLAKTSLTKIPLVHLRDDFTLDEIEFFIKKYKTEIFNFHLDGFPLKYDLDKYADKILVENYVAPLTESDLKRYGGLCLDITHLENHRRRFPTGGHYTSVTKYLKKYPCRAWHISAAKKRKIVDRCDHSRRYDCHWYKNLNEFDYAARYKKYLPQIVAIEVENSIAEQLKAKKYLEKILGLSS